jgi:hypothetical protein
VTAAFLNVAFAFNVILGSFRPPAFAAGGILAAFSSLWSALSPGSSTLFKTKIPCFTNVSFAKQGFLFGDGES